MNPGRLALANARSPSAGVALVLVLAVLVLLIGLAVALLSLSSNERKSASVFLATSEIRALSENAIGIVQAQVNYATANAIDPTTNQTEAWASQPGMVRTYTTAGILDTAYKLYSAKTLTQTDPARLGEDQPPANWASSPAVWTDLNAPVTVSTTTAGTTTSQSVYPIVDPGILALPTAQQPLGFAIDRTSAPGSTADPNNPAVQTVPMPVQWLYVLQGGQIVAPTVSGSTITVPGATATNPIKGRIAFWTDDESCKVNVNTAGANTYSSTVGAGSFWSTPHFYTTEDKMFATSQPINGEFQRYPGHLAMTSLTAVFPGLTDLQIFGNAGHTMSLTPRYQWGGSQQGTVNTYETGTALNNGNVATGALYADANEISFLPNTTSATAGQRDANPNLTHDLVQKSGFFLTADSRAPETNLFNLPRVACWPIPSDPASCSPFDPVIAFGATAGGYPYYFQRQSSMDGTVDAGIARNQQIFAYLQRLTGQTIPGFGVSLANKFGSDRDQILTEIWDYIRCTNLFDTRVALGKQFTADKNRTNSGYGYVVPLINKTASGTTYRGFGRSLTLAELGFVFICTADPKDTQASTTASPGHPYADGMLHSNSATNRTLTGLLMPNQRQVQMMIVPELFSPSQGDIQMAPKYTRVTISGLNTLLLGGLPLFAANSGSMLITDTTDAHSSFNTVWDSRPLGGAFDYRALLGGVSDAAHLDGSVTGFQACPFISNFVPVTLLPANLANAANPGTMSFTGGPLTVTIDTSTDNVTWSNPQTIPIRFGSTAPSTTLLPIPNLVRTGTVQEVDANGLPSGSKAPATLPQQWWAFSQSGPVSGVVTAGPVSGVVTAGRLTNLSNNPGYFKVSGNVALNANAYAGTLLREAEDGSYYTDVVRTVSPSFSDFRLIAGSTSVPINAFTETGTWTATGAANALIHTLGVGDQEATNIPMGSQYRRHPMAVGYVGVGTAGSYGTGGFIPPDFRSDAPTAVLNAVTSSGDFDNGTAFWPDGAFINKPDEGNVNDGGSTAAPYFDNSQNELIVSIGFFSPNRIMPGPGMFGSLPTHISRYSLDPTHPEAYAWRTLLFRKQPSHPDDALMTTAGLSSSGIAADHLLMDLFWMPAVEPYAISEPFSTAGKVNMNYALAPFPYITRKTGMYAVLQAEKMYVVPTTDLTTYKANNSTSSPLIGNAALKSLSQNLWTPSADGIAQTLQQFDMRFADPSGRLFLSPTELCDLWLVPAGTQLSAMKSFWASNLLTGDNMRERPYTNIIPRLTTKSNTFTVHYRVQGLKLPTNLPAGTWDESKGTIIGEYRGSTTIQRFINLNAQNPALPDFTTASSSTTTLDSFIRWRTLNTHQFAP